MNQHRLQTELHPALSIGDIGSAQLLVSLSDGSTQWLTDSDNHTELSWGLTQKTFIDEDETAVIGDFDGDGADEILVIDAAGDARFYEKPNGMFFAEKACWVTFRKLTCEANSY